MFAAALTMGDYYVTFEEFLEFGKDMSWVSGRRLSLAHTKVICKFGFGLVKNCWAAWMRKARYATPKSRLNPEMDTTLVGIFSCDKELPFPGFSSTNHWLIIESASNSLYYLFVYSTYSATKRTPQSRTPPHDVYKCGDNKVRRNCRNDSQWQMTLGLHTEGSLL